MLSLHELACEKLMVFSQHSKLQETKMDYILCANGCLIG